MPVVGNSENVYEKGVPFKKKKKWNFRFVWTYKCGHYLINGFNILQVIVFVCPSPASEMQGKPHTELHLKSPGDILAYMGI